MKKHTCFVCDGELNAIGKKYSIEQLFELWYPTKFTGTVIEEHGGQASETQLYRCAQCDFEVFLPQIIGSPSFYGELSEPNENNNKTAYYEDVKWDFLEAQNEVKHCQSIVEFGCGPGQFLTQSSLEGRKVVGVEYNEAAIETAKAKGLEVYSVGGLPEELKGTFDGAFTFHVLEHVSSPMDFLSEITSYVKPGGLIGVSVPNQKGPISYMDPCAMNMPPHHASRWSESSFRHVASRLGLEVERVSFEPLLLSNHSYYSKYWIERLALGKSDLTRIFLKILSYALKIFFRGLLLFSFRHFLLLRGQSIYMVFRKLG